jgi:hypothetical protein
MGGADSLLQPHSPQPKSHENLDARKGSIGTVAEPIQGGVVDFREVTPWRKISVLELRIFLNGDRHASARSRDGKEL